MSLTAMDFLQHQRFLKLSNFCGMELVNKLKDFKRSKERSIETVIELGNALNENVEDHGLNQKDLQLFISHCVDCLVGDSDDVLKNELICCLMDKQLIAIIDDCLNKNQIISELMEFYVVQEVTVFSQNFFTMISAIFDELTFVDNTLVSKLLEYPKFNDILLKPKFIQFLFSYFEHLHSQIKSQKIIHKLHNIIGQYKSKWNTSLKSIFNEKSFPIDIQFEVESFVSDDLINFVSFMINNPTQLVNCKAILHSNLKSSIVNLRFSALFFFVVLLHAKTILPLTPNDNLPHIFDLQFISLLEKRIADADANIRQLSIFTFPLFYWTNFKLLTTQLKSNSAEDRRLSIVYVAQLISAYLRDPCKYADADLQNNKFTFLLSSIGDRVLDREITVRQTAIDVLTYLFNEFQDVQNSLNSLLILSKLAKAYKITCYICHAKLDIFFNKIDGPLFVQFLNESDSTPCLLLHMTLINKIRNSFERCIVDGIENHASRNAFLSHFKYSPLFDAFQEIRPWLFDVFNNKQVLHSIRMLNDMDIHFAAVSVHLMPQYENAVPFVIIKDSDHNINFSKVCNVQDTVMDSRELTKSHLIMLKRFLKHNKPKTEFVDFIATASCEHARELAVVQVLCGDVDLNLEQPSWLLAFFIKYKNISELQAQQFLHLAMEWLTVSTEDSHIILAFKIVQYAIVKSLKVADFKPFIKLCFAILKSNGNSEEVKYDDPIILTMCVNKLLLKLATVPQIRATFGNNLFHLLCLQIQDTHYEIRESYIILLCKLLKLGVLDTNYLSSLYLLAFEPEIALQAKGKEILQIFSKRGICILT